MTAEEHLDLARKHLAKVQAAWDPPDWSDLSIYSFLCIENAVMAASIHAGLNTHRNHPSKASAAEELAAIAGLKDVSSLLRVLNDARKAESYGDIVRPEMDAEDLAREVEEYLGSVEEFVREHRQ